MTTREYLVTFNGRPTVHQLRRELDSAMKVFGEHAPVEVSSNGSSDPELEEVYLGFRSEYP